MLYEGSRWYLVCGGDAWCGAWWCNVGGVSGAVLGDTVAQQVHSHMPTILYATSHTYVHPHPHTHTSTNTITHPPTQYTPTPSSLPPLHAYVYRTAASGTPLILSTICAYHTSSFEPTMAWSVLSHCATVYPSHVLATVHLPCGQVLPSSSDAVRSCGEESTRWRRVVLGGQATSSVGVGGWGWEWGVSGGGWR